MLSTHRVFLATVVSFLAACPRTGPNEDGGPPGGGSGGAGGSAGTGGGSIDSDAGVELDWSMLGIDWTHAGVPGGIPNRVTACATLNPTASAATINNAIASCPSGQVVQLNAGTYNLDAPINLATKSNITLRGAGIGQTIINSTVSGNAVIASDQYGWSGATEITSGYSKGSLSIVVANASGFTVGNLVKLDENDDPDLVISADGPGRHLAFLSRIKAITGSTLTLETPMPYAFGASRSPRVRYLLGGPGISFTGIENLTVHNNGGADNIIFFNAAYACWVKNVELTNGNNVFAFLVDTLQCELRDSYIHGAMNAPANSDGYGVYLYYSSTYNKVENNIFDTLFVGPFQSGASANVFLYNYCHNGVGQSWPHQLGVMNANHGGHVMMTLWEGNVAEQWQNDGYHGTGSHQTLYRNWVHGLHPTNDSNRKMIDATRGSYFQNVVGNVLGSSWSSATQSASRYEMTGEPGYDEQQVIYRLGYPNVGNNGFTAANVWPTYTGAYPDSKVKSTLLRWGNYDYFSAAVRWDSAELPNGTAVPSQTLRASLYYATKPAWWPAAVVWPPIGPDVTGGSADPAGHAHKIPAQVCFEQGKAPGCI